MNLGIVNQFVKTGLSLDRRSLEWGPGVAQWAGGGFDDFLNLMNFLVFLIF